MISDAQVNVRRTTGQPDFDIEKVDLEDEKTFALLNSGRTTGVFQLESGGMQALCRQIGLSSFEEIIALIALYRPGPMQFIPLDRTTQAPPKIALPALNASEILKPIEIELGMSQRLLKVGEGSSGWLACQVVLG